MILMLDLSLPSGDHVLRLHRRGLVSPTSTLVAEGRRPPVVGELVGECGEGGPGGPAAEGLCPQSPQHGAGWVGRVGGGPRPAGFWGGGRPPATPAPRHARAP